MTEKWKLELVAATKQIAMELPELTEELRRFNNRTAEREYREQTTDIVSKDKPDSRDC